MNVILCTTELVLRSAPNLVLRSAWNEILDAPRTKAQSASISSHAEREEPES